MAYNYPYGNGQQLNLDWFLAEWKNLLTAWEAEKNGIEGALQAEIDRAEAAIADVLAARDAAAQSAANALESKNAAAQSASDASGYLATVRADANTAHNAAQNAAQSESNAADSAQTALASKNAAADSASDADASKRAAAQSASDADASKRAAAQSASDADASKSAAAQSASDADASKSAAAQSASDAEDAASSVEASVHQIATNANNIDAISTETSFTATPLEITTTLSSNGIIEISNNNQYRIYYAPIVKGVKYKIIAHDISASFVYGFFLTTPILDNITYNNDRIVNNSNEFIAPITGWIAFRSNSTISDEKITSRAAIDAVARNFVNLIAKELPNMVADTALTPNDFRIIANVLYRITTPIASGGTLTVGTNVVETTVADVLKSLLN